ncbi:XrtA system polysaccharide chain length determinant [Pleionea sp. CnH1-48]|uniref:XrtA system polysaccharide chain length determinant n=1 Tax=Pleionea sp. CnH1-48 TaxID=2954494 RepID=UPI0020969D68|nr:XrtA system polysaccharide chain length determinant [Pleionea sp. CnH1-48]MCO7226255.1 hypothetical protein [Pleionea sp. CnH1-48]
MQDLIDQIMHYVRGIARYRWQAVFIAWVLCLAGWPFVMKMPDQFQASTKFEVDTFSVLEHVIGGATTDSTEELRLLQGEVLSNTNIEKIIRKADLDLQVKTESELDALVKTVKGKISFKKQRLDNVFTISYMDNDPVLARQIVQLMLDLFQEKALGDKRKDSDQAQKFLDDQIDRYRAKLQDVESRLAEFKQNNLDRLPEQGKDYYQRLQEAKSKVREASLELKQSQNELQTLKSQLEKEQRLLNGSSDVDVSEVSVPEIDQRIAKINAQLDSLLLRYTEQHPDVLNAKRLIESLRKQKASMISSMGAQTKKNPSFENPVYQQLRIAIGEVEARVSSLKVKVSDYSKREQELEALLHELPLVEEKLADLTREYGIIKEHHDRMVTKREQARIQKEKEQSSNKLKFKIHDAPKTPSDPVGPKRLIFYTLILFAGCGVGLAVALLMSQVNTTFYDSKSLNSAISLPVIGTVSMVLSKEQIRKRWFKRILFLVVFAMLLAAYVGCVAIEVLKIQLI